MSEIENKHQTKSQFWKYRVYNSRRQKEKNGKSNGETWCGPFYFEVSANNLEVKKWIRLHLGIKDTSHIQAAPSTSEAKNKLAYSTFCNQRQSDLNLQINGARKAKSGNLMVKWLSPIGS